MKGELPELDVSLKKEPIKRKNDSKPGLQTKQGKKAFAHSVARFLMVSVTM